MVTGAERDWSESVPVSKGQVLEVGTRCYLRSARACPDLSSVWHDLAVNYHARANAVSASAEEGGGRSREDLVERSLAAAKKALALDPKSPQAWNLLGYLALSWDR